MALITVPFLVLGRTKMMGAGRRSFARLFIVFVMVGHALPSGANEFYQRAFERGSAFFADQAFDEAARTFLALFAQTNSTRVLLEAARATYFAGRYSEAGELFKRAYDRPDLPPAVQRNVRQYLAQIRQKTPSWNVSLGLKTDSNPTNFTYHTRVDALGTQLNVVKPETSEQHTGLVLDIEANIPLDAGAKWVLTPSIGAEEYDVDALDRQYGGVALSHTYGQLSEWQTRVALNRELRELGDDSDTVSLRHTLRVGGRPEWQVTGYASHKQYRQTDRSNVNLYDLSVAKLFPVSATTLAKAEAAGGRVRRDSEVQTANTARLGLTAYRVVGPVEVAPSLKVTRTAYREADLIFAERRIDFVRKAGVGLSSAQKRYGKLRPRIGLYSEKADSTVNYYEYRKWVVDVALDF